MKNLIAGLLFAAGGLGAEQTLGVINFPNSGSDAAQEDFLTGMALLHNFEYDDAATAFRRTQEADQGFGLAYWGEALTHYRPVWGRENIKEGKLALSRLTEESRLSEREAEYVRAARVLFGEGSKEDRWRRYSEAMGDLYRSDSDDMEAAALYAVSMFGTTGGTRDTRTYMQIAAVAEEVYRRNPDHPGALHYLIHSFDDPVHAPLGLRYAKRYSKVASSAPMPSTCLRTSFSRWACGTSASRQTSILGTLRKRGSNGSASARTRAATTQCGGYSTPICSRAAWMRRAAGFRSSPRTPVLRRAGWRVATMRTCDRT